MMTYYQERLLAIIEQADYRPLTKKPIARTYNISVATSNESMFRRCNAMVSFYATRTPQQLPLDDYMLSPSCSINWSRNVHSRQIRWLASKNRFLHPTDDLPSRTTTSTVSSRRFVMRPSTPLAFFSCTRGCGFRKPVTYSSQISTLHAISYSSEAVKAINHVRFRCIMRYVMS